MKDSSHVECLKPFSFIIMASSQNNIKNSKNIFKKDLKIAKMFVLFCGKYMKVTELNDEK